MTRDEFLQLSAGAALGALSATDLAAYRRAIAEHPEWAELAAADRETVAGIAELGEEVAPPAALRASILAEIERMPQQTVEHGSSDAARDVTTHDDAVQVDAEQATRAPVDAPPATTPARRSARPRPLRRRWFVLAASLLIAAGIGTGAVVAVQQLTQPAAVVALDRIEAAPDVQQATAQVAGGGPGTLHWSVSAGQAVLVTGDMPRLASDKTFELWYVRGATPISAGTFEADGDRTSALLDAGMKPGDVIAVTVEQTGGSSTGQPTTQPILTIPTA